MAVKNKSEYDWYKDNGICVRCMHEKAEKGYTMCRMCRLNYNDYHRVWQNQHEVTEERRQQNKESAQRRTERLHEQGLCFRCGKRPAAGTGKYSQCKICRERAARQKREREQKRGQIPTQLRGDGTYCLRCCKPLCNGQKLCPDCYQKAVANALKAAEASKLSPNRKPFIFTKYHRR